MLEIVVTGARGLDELLQAELQQLCPSCTITTRPGQALLQAELADAYRICLHSRLANRVLLKLAEGDIHRADDISTLADTINWQQHFDVSQTFVVDFFGTNKLINNSQFGALKIKDAIVDQFNLLLGQRPSVSKVSPDIRLQGRLWRDRLQIFLDLSGQSLHQRHYRQQTGAAPLKEHLACAMLIRSGWTKDVNQTLLDPMCGSGTIAIEGALISARIAPGLKRQKWGFSQWKQHQEPLWQELVVQAEQMQQPVQGKIVARDSDARVLRLARQNAREAGVENAITWQHQDALTGQADGEIGVLVTNPPYGERLSQLTALLPMYQQWGKQLKEQFKGWKLAILSANIDLLKQLKLVSKKRYQLMNGKLECQFALYEMDERNCTQREEQGQGNHQDFVNRLHKNMQRTQRWLKKQNTNCYRLYDADLPEYNVAIDCYADWLVVQEYAPPKTIAEDKARQRLHQLLAVLPAALNVDPTHIVLKVREQQKGKGQYQRLAAQQELLEVHENGAKFHVNLHDYLDTGLFLDHRDVRLQVQQRSRGKHILNLFAYTGSVSVHAALGGAASVTSVDMSKTYLDWARNNFELNGLRGSQYQFIQADCVKWLGQHNGQYDLIFIDPPSFSNSKRMDADWDVQRDYLALLQQALKCLAPGGEIIFSNNLRRFKIDEQGIRELGLDCQNWTQPTLPEDFKRHPKIHHCWLLQRHE